jgi:hypothetical protein
MYPSTCHGRCFDQWCQMGIHIDNPFRFLWMDNVGTCHADSQNLQNSEFGLWSKIDQRPVNEL